MTCVQNFPGASSVPHMGHEAYLAEYPPGQFLCWGRGEGLSHSVLFNAEDDDPIRICYSPPPSWLGEAQGDPAVCHQSPQREQAQALAGGCESLGSVLHQEPPLGIGPWQWMEKAL